MAESNHFQEVFQGLKSKGFETTSMLSWSFFFFSEKKSNLKAVIDEIDGYGYTTELSKFNKEYKLVISKLEILTPEKLEKRNIAFSDLADYCSVLFDGWEVSK